MPFDLKVIGGLLHFYVIVERKNWFNLLSENVLMDIPKAKINEKQDMFIFVKINVKGKFVFQKSPAGA